MGEKRRVSEVGRRLSKRQAECIELAAQGLLNKEIAFEIGISEVSVKALFCDALKKTNNRTRAQLIGWYMRSERIKFDSILKLLMEMDRKIGAILCLVKIR